MKQTLTLAGIFFTFVGLVGANITPDVITDNNDIVEDLGYERFDVIEPTEPVETREDVSISQEPMAKEVKNGKQVKDMHRMSEKHTAKLAQMLRDVNGKTITQPGGLLTRAMRIKARMLKLVAPKIQEIADKIKDKNTQQAISKTARMMRQLGDHLEKTPAIKQNVPITYNITSQMLVLLADLMMVKSEAIGNIGRQLNSESAKQVSQFKKQKAHMIKQALAQVA